MAFKCVFTTTGLVSSGGWPTGQNTSNTLSMSLMRQVPDFLGAWPASVGPLAEPNPREIDPSKIGKSAEKEQTVPVGIERNAGRQVHSERISFFLFPFNSQTEPGASDVPSRESEMNVRRKRKGIAR